MEGSSSLLLFLQVVIQNLDDAQELIDRAISAAINQSKPVYVSVCCNLANVAHPSFSKDPIPFSVTQGPEFKRSVWFYLCHFTSGSSDLILNL